MDKNVDYNYYGMPPFSGPNMYDMNADPTMDSNAAIRASLHVLSLFEYANGIQNKMQGIWKINI